MRFAWDETKNRANQRKHGISFEEAADLFGSGDYLEIFDEEHSEDEDRFIAIGFIGRGLVIVVWAQLEDDAGRIISARPAKKREQKLFETYMGSRR